MWIAFCIALGIIIFGVVNYEKMSYKANYLRNKKNNTGYYWGGKQRNCWKENKIMLDKKYEDILLGIKKALEYMNINYSDDRIVWTSIDGYHIMKLGSIEPDGTWFPKIDWLIANGYITQGKPRWCDITQSYSETYALTAKGNKYIEEIVERR